MSVQSVWINKISYVEFTSNETEIFTISPETKISINILDKPSIGICYRIYFEQTYMNTNKYMHIPLNLKIVLSQNWL